MLFDGADIIVLMIVILVLFLNRRFDKNSRTLENVRKYGDKVKGDLDAFVKEKKTQIHDLNIEADAQAQKNRAILQHMREENASLANQSEDAASAIARFGEVFTRAEELESVLKNLDENLSRIQKESEYVDSVGVRLNELLKRAGELGRGMEGLQEAFRAENARGISELRESFHHEMTGVYQEHSAKLEEADLRVIQFRESVEELLKARDNAARERLDEFTARWTEVEEGYMRRLEKAGADGVALEADVFLNLKELLASHQERLSSAWSGETQKLERRFQDLTNSLTQGMDDLENDHNLWKSRSEEQIVLIKEQLELVSGEQQRALEQMEKRQERFAREFSSVHEGMMQQKDQLNRDFENLGDRLQELSGTFTEKIEDTAETLQLEALQTIEQKLQSYDKGFSSRFQRLEQFILEMDGLEDALRYSMAETKDKVLEDFQAFDHKMQGLRADEERAVEARAEKTREGLTELEEGLNHLKSQAYDNVSQQLQVFEDAFFDDLKQRDGDIKKSLSDWEEKIELQLEGTSEEHRRERRELERRYSGELEQELGALKVRVGDNFDTFRKQVEDFRDTLEQRMDEGTSRFNRFDEDMQEELSALKANSMTRINRELEGLNSALEKGLELSEKELNQKLTTFAGDLDASQQDFTLKAEELARDVELWKEKVLRQVKEQEGLVAGRYGEFKSSLTEHLKDLQEDFKAQKEELVLAGQDERADLKQELAAIGDKVSALQRELKEKTDKTMERFNSDYQLFTAEFQGKLRDARNDADLKIKEMRQGIAEAQDTMDAYRKKLTFQVEKDAQRLGADLEVLEKKQKEVLSRNQIFDRADRMKAALDRSIAELQRDLDKVESDMRRLKDYQDNFGAAQEQYDKVQEQINRFTSEGHRVEELAEKIKGMDGLSRSADLKLAQITSMHSTLQQYLDRAAELGNEHHALDSRFALLESKAALVDQASAQIEGYRQMAEVLDSRLSAFQQGIQPLAQRLEALERQSGLLLEHRSDADEVYRQVGELQGILENMEGRIQKAEEARQWIAKTETRLEAVLKQAKNEIQVLGRLASPGGARTGALDMDQRKMAVRLAKEGWKVDAIARTVGLSQSEVELILETSGRD